MPYYLCNVIRQSVVKEGCRPVFYHIDDKFMPDKEFNKYDYILYPNYFGICEKNVENLSKKYRNLIVDNAHSFYSEPKGLACFNSARKFLPVYNGSVLWIKKIDKNIKYETEKYKNYSAKDTDKYENIFLNSEPAFISEQLKNEFFNTENYNLYRKKIFIELHNKYKFQNQIEIDIENIIFPFCYPLLCENEVIADEIADKLTNKGYKIFRYWNNLPKNYNEYKFFRYLIPITL